MSAENYSSCLEKYPKLLDHNVFFDILIYIHVKRPLSCAKHFNKSPRKLPCTKLMRVLKKGFTYQKVEDNKKSMISVTASRDSWLHCCVLVLSANDSECIVYAKVYLDELMIQDSTKLFRRSDTQSLRDPMKYQQYELFFNKPILCTMNKTLNFCFELDEVPKMCPLPIIGESFTDGNIKIDVDTNYFLMYLSFTDKL